jgi:hypothetical protein
VLPDLVGRGFLGRSPERIRRGLYSSQPKVGLIVTPFPNIKRFFFVHFIRTIYDVVIVFLGGEKKEKLYYSSCVLFITNVLASLKKPSLPLRGETKSTAHS